MMLIHSKPYQGAKKSTHPDIENWCVAEAMIASYNHVYQVTYGTKYKRHGPIGISIYEYAPIAAFQYEFLVLNDDANAVLGALHSSSFEPVPFQGWDDPQGDHHPAGRDGQSQPRSGERTHPPHTLSDRNIHSFYTSVDGEAAGWLQLVTLYPDVGYINQLYVLQAYRRLGYRPLLYFSAFRPAPRKDDVKG